MENSGIQLKTCLVLVVCLIAAVFIGGCTETTATPPLLKAAAEKPQPGVMLQQIGDVTGQGIVPTSGVAPVGMIDTVTFTIGLAPGTKTIDLEKISIIYADAVRMETLTNVSGYRGAPPQGSWGILSVENEIGKPNNRLEFNEQARIQINPKAPILPGQVFTIAVKAPDGNALILRRVAPQPIVQNTNNIPAL